MVFETILETVFPLIGRILGFIFFEILTYMVMYSIGFVFLKIITFGKYPEEYISPYSELKQEAYVYMTGILICVLLVIVWLI